MEAYMKLEDFISETLNQIVAGVKTAQEHTKGTGAKINPSHGRPSTNPQPVDFDVAVTTTEGTNKKGGLGVFVYGIGIGAQGAKDISNQSISRIRFQVPVQLPPG